MEKNKQIFLNAKLINWVVLLLGIIGILTGVLLKKYENCSVILLSIGTSLCASSVITFLNAKYLITQHNSALVANTWGLDAIYETRAEINTKTNRLLAKAHTLDICAMGLKNFREAKGETIKQGVLSGMSIRILTLNPNNPILSEVDENERLVNGSTKETIKSLIKWGRALQDLPGAKGNIEIKTYNQYPYDFYFNIDGTVYTGPYERKSSQQTITYSFAANSKGAEYYKKHFEKLWSDRNNGTI